MATGHTTVPISLVTQANDVLYSLLEKSRFERTALPVDVNLLSFTKQGLDVKYRELLYCNRLNKANFSPDLINNLIFFYFCITGYFVLTLIIVLEYYFREQISTSEVLLQLCPFFAILCVYYFVLHFTRTRRSLMLNIRSLYCCLNVVMVLYFLFTDKRMLNVIYHNNDDLTRYGNHTYIVLLFLFLSLCVTMYHFYSMLLISAVTVIAHMSIQISIKKTDNLALLEEILVLVTYSTLLCFVGYQHEYRSKQIFYQLQREEQAHTTNTQNSVAKNSAKAGIRTEVEKAADLCDSVRKIIKEASTVIIFKDVRTQLKDVITKVEDLRNKIVRGLFVEQVELELPQVDEEDEIFIRQNYLEKTVISRKNTLLTKRTINDIPMSAGLPDYGFEEVNAELQGVGRNWNFDIWSIYDQAGKSIFLVGNYLIMKWEFHSNYDLDEAVLNECFRRIEAGYKDNPYHNACHAADVCHSLMYFINHSDLIKNISGLELLASILASLSHDIGHPGVTNRFLINNQDDLAIAYNDISVLENMHVSTLFRILSHDDANVLENVQFDDWVVIRKLIIEMILETDMSKHFASVGRFRSVSNKPGINFNKQDDKFFCLAFALKCADVGHSAKAIELHVKWSEKVMEEFFQQGDMERERGQEISMYCDRETTDFAKSQAAFLTVICMPMFEAWTDFLRSDEVNYNCRSQIRKNLDYWENRANGHRSTTPDQAKPAKLLRFLTFNQKRTPDE